MKSIAIISAICGLLLFSSTPPSLAEQRVKLSEDSSQNDSGVAFCPAAFAILPKVSDGIPEDAEPTILINTNTRFIGEYYYKVNEITGVFQVDCEGNTLTNRVYIVVE